MASSRWFASRWIVRVAVVLGVALTVLALFGQDRVRTPLHFHERDLLRRAEPERPVLRWIGAQSSALPEDRIQREREGQLTRVWTGAETWITHRLPIRRELLGAGLHAFATARHG